MTHRFCAVIHGSSPRGRAYQLRRNSLLMVDAPSIPTSDGNPGNSPANEVSHLARVARISSFIREAIIVLSRSRNAAYVLGVLIYSVIKPESNSQGVASTEWNSDVYARTQRYIMHVCHV